MKSRRNADVLTFHTCAGRKSRQSFTKPIVTPMQSIEAIHAPAQRRSQGFSLVEMIVVIAIMSILMTAGAIGLSNVGGKGVTNGVSTAEMLFAEARTIAQGQGTRARVLIAKDLTNSPAENLRRIIVVYEKLDEDGKPIKDEWVLSSRGTVLPDQVYYSQEYSKRDATSGADGTGIIEEMPSLPNAKRAYEGSYFYYEYNAEGICSTPGASFVIGSGRKNGNSPSAKPRVIASAKKDFGGFVIWRNGNTSVFRSPIQISSAIDKIKSGAEF
jgi:prepilin-type N-terminal cleavage/methylation domain-containing protein